MATFEWHQKESTHFGRVWVPIVIAQFQAPSGRFCRLHMFVDSGAVVSLVRRSMAEELGRDLEAGRPVQLTNAGGASNEAFVHDLTMRLTNEEKPMIVPVAIAVRENVPNLLGRLGVFDRRHIEFDPRQRLTRIESPHD